MFKDQKRNDTCERRTQQSLTHQKLNTETSSLDFLLTDLSAICGFSGGASGRVWGGFNPMNGLKKKKNENCLLTFSASPSRFRAPQAGYI